jgi:hypothetical protein
VFCAEKRGRVGEENAFFEFFLLEVSTAPPPALPIYPRGGDPSPSAPGQTAQNRQQRRPCRTDQDGGGCWRAQRLYVACATFLCACTFNLEYTIDLYV